MSDADVAAQLRAIADQLDPQPVSATTLGIAPVLAPQDMPGAGVIDPGFLNKPNTDPVPDASADTTDVSATPAAQALADEKGVDLSTVEATGAGGGVVKQDVVDAVDHANTVDAVQASVAAVSAASTDDERAAALAKAQADVDAAVAEWPDSAELQDAKAQLDKLASK